MSSKATPAESSATSHDEGRKPVLHSLRILLTDEVLNKVVWIFLLLPGFFSYTCTSLIVPTEVRSELEVLAFSFTYLLINIAVTLAVFLVLVIASRGRWRPDQSKHVGPMTAFIIALYVVSFATGIAGGVLLERDVFFKLAKSVPFVSLPIQDSIHSPIDRILLQNQTGLSNHKDPSADGRIHDGDKPSITNQAFARITLSDGSIFEGWPLYFDSRRRSEQIYLTPACELTRVDDSLDVRPIGGPGMVVYERDIRSLIFFDLRTTRCSKYWYTPPEERSGIREICGLRVLGNEIAPHARECS